MLLTCLFGVILCCPGVFSCKNLYICLGSNHSRQIPLSVFYENHAAGLERGDVLSGWGGLGVLIFFIMFFDVFSSFLCLN